MTIVLELFVAVVGGTYVFLQKQDDAISKCSFQAVEHATGLLVAKTKGSRICWTCALRNVCVVCVCLFSHMN